MLIYFIIAAELAILYVVFWYVYVREPKPGQLNKGGWGKYAELDITTNGANQHLNDQRQPLLAEWMIPRSSMVQKIPLPTEVIDPNLY